MHDCCCCASIEQTTAAHKKYKNISLQYCLQLHYDVRRAINVVKELFDFYNAGMRNCPMKLKMTTIWLFVWRSLPINSNKVHLLLRFICVLFDLHIGCNGVRMSIAFNFWLRLIMCLNTFYLIIIFFLVNGFRSRK